MLVYGDQVRRVVTATALDDLASTLQRVAQMGPGIERHGALVAAFVAAGELAQGIADAEFEVRGCDARSPPQDAAMALLMALARAVHRSWMTGFTEVDNVPTALVRRLIETAPPGETSIRTPEGYAFYAVYPESYLEAASSLSARPLRLIGIRSIGTGLAALVAAATGTPDVVTVRPVGEPFRREIRLGDDLRAELLGDSTAHFAVVDEGPGLSGSSFGAVADWLEAHRVAPERIHFFPSHGNDLGPMASKRHRERWGRASRHVIAFDDLALRASRPMHRLESWVADLVGEAEAPLQDISGGEWRRRSFSTEAEWPPCHVQQERRKFLATTKNGTWLLKFVGLGAENAAKLRIARELHAAALAPEPVGYRHGFLVERWIDDAHPLQAQSCERAALIETLGGYIGHRARAFPAEPHRGASLAQLAHMARRNAGLGLGEASAALLARWDDDLPRLEGGVRRVRTDNRLHPWEWLQTGDGAFVKTDAIDHHAAHDLIGCQDAAWDIAGAHIEFDLTESEVARLSDMVARRTGHEVSPDLLAFYLPCYAAFQLGYWSLAAESLVGFPAEAARTRAAAENYRRKLAHLLRY